MFRFRTFSLSLEARKFEYQTIFKATSDDLQSKKVFINGNFWDFWKILNNYFRNLSNYPVWFSLIGIFVYRLTVLSLNHFCSAVPRILEIGNSHAICNLLDWDFSWVRIFHENIPQIWTLSEDLSSGWEAVFPDDPVQTPNALKYAKRRKNSRKNIFVRSRSYLFIVFHNRAWHATE